jgi:hypothetical protein
MHSSFWQILFGAIVVCGVALGYWVAAGCLQAGSKPDPPFEEDEFEWPDDELPPYYRIKVDRNAGRRTFGPSGNSHDRRIARRELERAKKLHIA